MVLDRDGALMAVATEGEVRAPAQESSSALSIVHADPKAGPVTVELEGEAKELAFGATHSADGLIPGLVKVKVGSSEISVELKTGKAHTLFVLTGGSAPKTLLLENNASMVPGASGAAAAG